jgi:alpha-galactosidase
LPFIDAIPDAGNPPASVIDSLVQLKLVGDPYPGAFAQGHTLRESPSIDRFRYLGQTLHDANGGHLCVTTLESREGLQLEHRIAWRDGDAAFTVSSSFRNGSEQPITLEMLSSFSLGGITPFHEADAPGRLRVHRFRSAWSAEGRLETRSFIWSVRGAARARSASVSAKSAQCRCADGFPS